VTQLDYAPLPKQVEQAERGKLSQVR